MIKKVTKYLFILFLIYFSGHFLLTMAYSFGSSSIVTAVGILSFAAVVFTFYKASKRSESAREILYGIFAGYFLWSFAGEILEQAGILGIADFSAWPALAAYVVIVSVMALKRYLPFGTRLGLGHFGYIWLNHFILVNLSEVLKYENYDLFRILIAAAGATFLLIAFFLFIRMIMSKSEKAFVTFLLFAFISLWSIVESLQVMHILPDFTYFSFWSGEKSPANEGRKRAPGYVVPDEKIESFIRRFKWQDEYTRGLAVFLIQNRYHGHIDLQYMVVNLHKKLKNDKKAKVDADMFGRVFKDSISHKLTNYFDLQTKRYFRQFESERKAQAPFQDKIDPEIISIIERYKWKSSQTKQLAAWVLTKLSAKRYDEFKELMDRNVEEGSTGTADEKMLYKAVRQNMTNRILDSVLMGIKRDIVNYREGSR